VARAKLDGYTILTASSSPILLAPILKKHDYNPDDFIPVGVFGKFCNWLAVKADAKWKNLREFIAEERKFPGKLKAGSYGKLPPADFAIELMNKYEKIKLSHIPYKSLRVSLEI
jgi:tripartite-type tricarboxylate transporter receptor subunit TctC